jgi:hypothetical protein
LNFRNRKLLDLAHRICECQNCGRYTPEGSEPAHSNLMMHGKGVSIKAHDCFFAALCHACHAWLDQGGGDDPSGAYTCGVRDKQMMWQAAANKTLLLLWRNGWIKVEA